MANETQGPVNRPGAASRSRASAVAMLSAIVALTACAGELVPPPTGIAVGETPAPTAAPSSAGADDAEFGALLRLERGRLLTPKVAPGGRVRLELTWRLLRPTTRDLRVSGRLIDLDGRTRARRDLTVGGVGAGTSGWPAGAAVADELELPLPDGIAPGRYDLLLEVADPTSGVRLPITAEGGFGPVVVDYQYALGAVRVGPPAQPEGN